MQEEASFVMTLNTFDNSKYKNMRRAMPINIVKWWRCPSVKRFYLGMPSCKSSMKIYISKMLQYVV